MVSGSPQQQSLASESDTAKLNELLDRSLTEEGLTSNIADLLFTLTGGVQLAPSESSSLKIGRSVPSVSSVNTRMAMSDFGAISKFSGNENDKNSILNVMSQYEAFVTASLKSRPGVTEDMIDDLLITYFIFVLKDEAIQFYTQLVGGSSPVTKGVLASTLVASAFLHARDPDGNFNVTLDIWRVLTEGELWRLVSCHAVCTSMGPLLATSLSLYRLRSLEPLLGSKKFAAFVAVTSVLTIPFEASAGVYFGTVRLTPGPLPLVFALLVVYYAIVPPSKPRLFGALGMEFTDKAFTFAVAGMLACCEGWNSMVPAVCGVLVGGLYLMDTMSIQSVRLPSIVYRCFSRFSRPLTAFFRRGGGASSPPSNSTGGAHGTRAIRRPRQPQPLLGPTRGAGGGGGGIFSHFMGQPQRQGSARFRNTSPPPPPPPPEETIATLTGMGFERAAVLQALVQTRNDSFAAANLLVSRAAGVSGGGASTASAPLTPAAATSTAAAAASQDHDHAS
eukprot:jgi/Undpi1/2966/HiC_scaffold_14.g06343.m1